MITRRAVSADPLREDAALRLAFRDGERWALSEVYRVYFPVAVNVATRGFGNFRGFWNPADRDDAVQTIFAAAFEEKCRLSYNGIDGYPAFLRGIGHNVIRRMLERDTRFRRTDGQPELEFAAPESAEEVLADAQLCRLAAEFRGTVKDPPEPEILDRYFVQAQAEEGIAVDLGLTRYRVRKVIALLDKRMRRFMKAHGLE